jgi:hypothetical protein
MQQRGGKGMATNKSGMKPGSGLSAGRKPDADLGQALLAVIGLGLAGGIALIGGAVKLGEKVLDLQVKAYEKIETERESRREAVRQIAENEMEFGVDPEASDKEEN